MSRPPTPPPSPGAGDLTARPVRRDAQRNRDKLLSAAQAAFAADEGLTSLESIARRAGVGIGTLYRHFPTREDLVDAVYASELDATAASVPALLGQHPADVALRAWLGRYAAFVATKRGMMDTLRTGFTSGRIATPSRERVTTAIATFLEQGVVEGTLRADVDPDDVTTMLLGVFIAIVDGAAQERTDRLLDLLTDVLRPRISARANS